MSNVKNDIKENLKDIYQDNVKWMEYMRKTRKYGFNITVNQSGYRIVMVCPEKDGVLRTFNGHSKTTINDSINDCKAKFGWDNLVNAFPVLKTGRHEA